MKYSDEENLDKDFIQTLKKEKVTKDDILDDTYKKAEFIKEKNLKNKKKKKKKPFYQSGILLIFVALICLAIINYAPWAFIKTDYNDGEEANSFIFKNYDQNDIGYDNGSLSIIDIFEPNNCSSYNCNYIGLDFNDFSSIPKITTYGFLFLALLGLIFLITQLIDRIYNFNYEIFTIYHSIHSGIVIIVSMFLLTIILRLLAVNLLIVYNDPFIFSKNIIFISPIAIILIFIFLGIIKTSFSTMKINTVQLQKRYDEKQSKNPFFIYKGGSKT